MSSGAYRHEILHPKDILVIQTPLGTDIDGDTHKEIDKRRYESVVGMLHYLSINARPDI